MGPDGDVAVGPEGEGGARTRAPAVVVGREISTIRTGDGVKIGAAGPMPRGMSDYDRRIGDRVDMAAIPVLWRVSPPGRKRRARLSRKPDGESALLRDLSVSGLQIRALAADDLQVGVVVHVEVDGVVGWGTIRRMAAVPGTRFCDYGLELSPRATALVEMVHGRVGSMSRATEADWR